MGQLIINFRNEMEKPEKVESQNLFSNASKKDSIQRTWSHNVYKGRSPFQYLKDKTGSKAINI